MGTDQKHYVISAVIACILLLATRVIIDIGETVAYVLCAVAAGVSLLWYALAPDAAAPMHFLGISLVTLYQSHFVIEHVHAEWWLEAFMCTVAVVVFCVDYYIWYLSMNRTTDIPKDARQWYHVMANVVIASMAYVPLHGAGMFNIKHTGLLGVFALLQFGLGITENRRNIPPNFFRMPNPAIKCMALLYLPPRDWPFFGAFLLFNIIGIRRMKTVNKTESDVKESA